MNVIELESLPVEKKTLKGIKLFLKTACNELFPGTHL